MLCCRRRESLLPRDADPAGVEHAAGQLLAQPVSAGAASGNSAAARAETETVGRRGLEHQVRLREGERGPGGQNMHELVTVCPRYTLQYSIQYRVIEF